MLAKEWLESAEKYEERLRAIQSLNPQIVEAILCEKNRIHSLFRELLPEFAERISVVITTEALVEHCAIFSWNNHLYILVSGALIGRPYDHPKEPGLKAWEWLAHHEKAHILGNHLPWFFHTRRLFRFTTLFCFFQKISLDIFDSNHVLSAIREPCLWFLGGTWLLQTFVGLVFEWQADLAATNAVKESLVLEDVQKTLHRMTSQSRKRWANPLLGWVRYIMSMLFQDPHPPWFARRWLLQRRLRSLKISVNQETE